MIAQADSRHIPLAPGSVHMVACSPPYFGLRQYAAGAEQMGAEREADCLAWARREPPCGRCFVCNLRAVGAEVWRILRDDGTWWLNLGDSYADDGKWGGASGGKHAKPLHGETGIGRGRKRTGLKPKDLCMIPARVALALQADGWTVRSDIIWHKPAVMPESVEDRPTRAHEYVFLLTKGPRYFYDYWAVREPSANAEATARRMEKPVNVGAKEARGGGRPTAAGSNTPGLKPFDGQRNRRSVWTIAAQGSALAHFAMWPEALVDIMIQAGTSARGVCAACGAPWTRTFERTAQVDPLAHGSRFDTGKAGENHGGKAQEGERFVKRATGWKPSCACPPADPVPAIVLDIFAGSGTTGAVARALGRRFVGLDLSFTYLRDIALARAEAKTPPSALADLPMFANLGG